MATIRKSGYLGAENPKIAYNDTQRNEIGECHEERRRGYVVYAGETQRYSTASCGSAGGHERTRLRVAAGLSLLGAIAGLVLSGRRAAALVQTQVRESETRLNETEKEAVKH
jgi:hypothetical protein